MAVDKLLAYVNGANKRGDICFLEAGDSVAESWVSKKGKSFLEGFAVDGNNTSQGTLSFNKVASNVKINRLCYVDYAHTPLYRDHLMRLYKNKFDKVTFHHY